MAEASFALAVQRQRGGRRDWNDHVAAGQQTIAIDTPAGGDADGGWQVRLRTRLNGYAVGSRHFSHPPKKTVVRGWVINDPVPVRAQPAPRLPVGIYDAHDQAACPAGQPLCQPREVVPVPAIRCQGAEDQRIVPPGHAVRAQPF